jgi:chromosome segregation ATPase
VRAAHERAERAEAHEAEAQRLAERRGEEIAELRQQLGRIESEVKALRIALDDAKDTRDGAESRAMAEREERKRERERAERLEAERDGARAELAKWRAGGPLTRAWRALVARQMR